MKIGRYMFVVKFNMSKKKERCRWDGQERCLFPDLGIGMLEGFKLTNQQPNPTQPNQIKPYDHQTKPQ